MIELAGKVSLYFVIKHNFLIIIWFWYMVSLQNGLVNGAGFAVCTYGMLPYLSLSFYRLPVLLILFLFSSV